LSLLQMAAETILGFFLQHYWKLQDPSKDSETTSLQQPSRESEVKRATVLLQEYVIRHQQQIQNVTISPLSQQPVHHDGNKGCDQTSFQSKQNDDYENDIESLDESEDWMTDNMYACLVQNPVASKRRKALSISDRCDKSEPSFSPSNIDRSQDRFIHEKYDNDDLSQSILDEFVDTVPQDIVYHVILDWLIWGNSACDSSGSSSSSCGAIFDYYQASLSTRTAPISSKSPIFMIPKYLCQHYPGLANAILTHLVEYRLCHIAEESSNILARWVQDHLEFWQSYASYLPLTWLAQRLELEDPLRLSIERIVLGKNASYDQMQNQQPRQEEIASKSLSSIQEQELTSASCCYPRNAIHSWQLVDSWEPCSIGTLPGHAV
jgi:hypothetical protein